ncbi:hypothetical protein INT48_003903 [Thamnidium elegans]|uniref:1-(5-phosphoribosyl)-5-[(5-phosphoribosylamino)methylideneamino] imidazole-4-carboxamide isomerase n=1 Tax=Thamnidium elegans TaxID=101142 RepID=A0A8H7SQB8_9FUNG|nr:hypothetical protein INT48_003903 [Thamnidium elegans]
MTRFNGCIDLHHGKVKQIVGGSLLDHSPDQLTTNFVSEESPSFYSKLYKENDVTRCHVIKLGPNNDEAAKEALAAWPNGLQVGGGITLDNAQHWLSLGASKVIVTSYLFPGATFSKERLIQLCELVGKDRLVVDVSCRKKNNKWLVAMDKWQTMTDMEVNKETLDMLSKYCSEFLIHAADVEGLCNGIDEELVERLGEWVTIPTTYAGGGRSMEDLKLVDKLSNGKVDLTFGRDLNQLVMNYLVVEGYKDAAEQFSSESGLAPTVDLQSIQERMDIRHAIQSGDVDTAIDLILDTNPHLFFHLQQQRLIELIRKGSFQEALEFASEEMAPRGEEHPEFLEELERTMALLAFQDSIDSPVQDLLHPGQRQKTASELNAAILLSQSQEKDPKLPNLLKMLAWSQEQLDERMIYPKIENWVKADLVLQDENGNNLEDIAM